MGNTNIVAISGNLTRDPELRSSAGGTAFLNFSIANNERRKNQQSGEWEDYANFFDCVCIGKRAEALATFLAKGMKVSIAGKLSWRSWEDTESGKKRSAVSIVVDEIDVMSNANSHGGGSSAPARSGAENGTSAGGGGYTDDDIPF